MLLGISTGVQAMAARRVGEGRTDSTAVPLNGGILCVWVLGIPLAIAVRLKELREPLVLFMTQTKK